MKKSHSLRTSFFVALFFFCFFEQLYAAEKVCKLEVLNCQGRFVQNSSLPTVNLWEKTTIRVWGRFANWVTNGILIDQVTPRKDKLYFAELELSNKHDAQTACETYIDIVIPRNGLYTGKQVIQLSGAAYGAGFSSTLLEFEIQATRDPIITRAHLYYQGAGSSLILVQGTELQAGDELILKLDFGFIIDRTELENLTKDLDFTGSDFKVVNVGYLEGNMLDYSRNYNVVFQSKQSTYRFKTIKYSAKGNFCQTNNFSYEIPGVGLIIKPLEKRIDLADNGLQGKFALQHYECDGLSLIAAKSNNRTLEHVREQIPAPTAAEPFISRLITWPDIRWGVINNGESTTTSFQAKLFNGNTLLQTVTINGLASGEYKNFSYTRPESIKLIARRSCNANALFMDTRAPAHISEIEIRQRMSWEDPEKFTIKIDTNNSVKEIDESNNTVQY